MTVKENKEREEEEKEMDEEIKEKEKREGRVEGENDKSAWMDGKDTEKCLNVESG